MDIRNKIYDLLTDSIDDIDRVEEINEHIDELETNNRNLYKKDIKELKEHISLIENRLDYEEKQNKLLKNMIKHFSIFRCALNKVVNEYWIIHKSKIENLDYNKLCANYNSRKRFDINNGFKYAIARIHNECEGLSIELCKLYLELNDSFHPKLKPITVVEESIDKIREIISNDCVPDCYKSIGLNDKLLNDFEQIIKSNSKLLG
jgi:hypothetical protein